jgi:carboxymethylenebutenolidase
MIVHTSYRDLDTPTGLMRTHVYAPAGTHTRKYPGLLLYPEIFQQTAPIVRLSTMFASHGYVVMAPEIYHEHEPPGTVLGYDEIGKDKGNAYKQQTKLSTFDADAKVVIGALREHLCATGASGPSVSASAGTWPSAPRSIRRSWPPAVSIRPTCTAEPSAKAGTPTPWRARRS